MELSSYLARREAAFSISLEFSRRTAMFQVSISGSSLQIFPMYHNLKSSITHAVDVPLFLLSFSFLADRLLLIVHARYALNQLAVFGVCSGLEPAEKKLVAS
jgi:uncharacterized membrane protein YGL010W